MAQTTTRTRHRAARPDRMHRVTLPLALPGQAPLPRLSLCETA